VWSIRSANPTRLLSNVDLLDTGSVRYDQKSQFQCALFKSRRTGRMWIWSLQCVSWATSDTDVNDFDRTQYYCVSKRNSDAACEPHRRGGLHNYPFTMSILQSRLHNSIYYKSNIHVCRITTSWRMPILCMHDGWRMRNTEYRRWCLVFVWSLLLWIMLAMVSLNILNVRSWSGCLFFHVFFFETNK
jgi:hypothetical protein